MSLFALPNEVLLSSLTAQFPCRDQQIRSLATLLSIGSVATRNIVLHGLEATGKSSVVEALLAGLSSKKKANGLTNGNGAHHESNLSYAIVRSAECIGGRHLLEQTIGEVAQALGIADNVSRCENLAQLVVEVERMMEGWLELDSKKRLVLVFDGIDRQRDAPPTLLPALARMGEVIPNLTTIFVVTSPRPNFLHFPGAPHIEFPAYNKIELMKIISLVKPSPALTKGKDGKDAEEVTRDTWIRFCTAVWESLAKHSGRDLVSLRSVCLRLWPRFARPILDGSLDPIPFSRVMVASRSLFQNEKVLIHNLVSNTPTETTNTQSTSAQIAKYHGIGAQLPFHSRLILVAAYLASFNPPKTDQLLFMKAGASKRRKKGGGTALTSRKPGVMKHRKIARKLLGPQAFVLERLLAIFHAIKGDADAGGKYQGKGRPVSVTGNADIQMAIATLASLRLLVRLGPANAADVLDSGVRYRVAVGWEVVRGIGRSLGVEVEDYLID